ncbi:putative phage tail protein [Paenibacillus chungangensis]|uniref:Phage tail protein n=1 Tax=Paenibacillus chungangensis TaxID=696535 RepID=A0ABW3HR99_9BACL
MSNDVMKHWPPLYEGIADFRELAATESDELSLVRGAVQRQLDDRFVMTSGVGAVRRRERMLGIQADPETESLGFRRLRIVNRYSTKPPFTKRYLQEQIDRLIGPGMAVVTIDEEGFLLTLTANIDSAAIFKEVQHTIETVKPANLVYQQKTSLGSKIQLKERITAQEVTWNYKLDGSWMLGTAPFASYGAEVPVT